MAHEVPRVRRGSAAAQRLEEQIAFIQEYVKLWRMFFESLSHAVEGRKIVRQDEEEFTKIINSLARHHYRFTAMSQPHMSNPDAVLKVLCETISLGHIKTLSEAQISKIQVDWHTVFIDMNKALGRLIAQRPLTPEEEAMAKRGAPPPEPVVASAAAPTDESGGSL